MDSSQNQSQMSVDDSEEGQRIINLQNLIEKNIEIEQQIEKNTIDASLSAIESIISKANDIVKGYEERRTNSTELVLDTELLRRNHEVVGKAIEYNSNFTDIMMVSAIENLVFKETEEDWNAICSLAVQFGAPHFTNDSMLPFIDVTPKERIPKQRAQRKPKSQVAEKRPKISDKLERKDEGAASVSHILKQIRQIYKDGGNQPIPYFKLICNPDNFMDTVQNALQVSFLVKENYIAVENGADGLPLVRVVPNHKAPGQAESSQAICSIDVAYCNKMVKHYSIHQPLLKKLHE
ncbi:uncharacterized protein Nse4 [Drosophila bipectinata]|uniref:uncharacterized protein Nse4 n=1 Tax=Drosophila bipectinata TaxID=42026 RepID=UPI001C89B268|nr:non-structural maintenance of chromosome element 4 [Drosophila bipectinata]